MGPANKYKKEQRHLNYLGQAFLPSVQQASRSELNSRVWGIWGSSPCLHSHHFCQFLWFRTVSHHILSSLWVLPGALSKPIINDPDLESWLCTLVARSQWWSCRGWRAFLLFPDNKVLGPEKIKGLSRELEKGREREAMEADHWWAEKLF